MITSKSKNVLIIDSEIGNIGSVYRAVIKIGHKPIISNNKKKFNNVNHIILPGVGSFDYGMKTLQDHDLIDSLNTAVNEKRIPLLGICLGMQLLASKGFENNKETDGLNFIPGNIEKFKISNELKLPHLGWNEVYHNNENPLFKNIPNNKDFYFVHNYFFNSFDEQYVIGKTYYGTEFTSAVNKSNIYGVQFHPEKSLKFGIKLLENFLSI